MFVSSNGIPSFNCRITLENVDFSLFINGHIMHIDRLYPPIEFPVSRGTPMISPLLEWDHTENYFVSRFEFQQDCKSGQRKVIVAIEDSPFLSGHVIDGNFAILTIAVLLMWYFIPKKSNFSFRSVHCAGNLLS